MGFPKLVNLVILLIQTNHEITNSPIHQIANSFLSCGCHIVGRPARLILSNGRSWPYGSRMNGSELRAELERLHPESYGWALGCCFRNAGEAESVLQTVYLKVLEGKARFDGKARFKTWLFSVIRKTAADRRRRSILQRIGLTRYETYAPDRNTADQPEQAVYRSELQIRLSRALAQLPQRQGQALQLVFYHDLTVEEAAGVMNVSVGSARTHYERGKKRLRQLMAESGVFNESESGRTETQSAVPRP
jgi:RNA polymerase sigma-70 factor (ECF subfamily)